MGKRRLRALSALIASFALFTSGIAPGVAQAPQPPSPGGDTPSMRAGAVNPEELLNEEDEDRLILLDQQFIAGRTAGDVPLSVAQAAALRSAAANKAKLEKNPPPPGPTTFDTSWSAMGPNPIVQSQRSDGSFTAMSGRIGALAIRQSGQFILGAAQGGIWLYTPPTPPDTLGTWTPKTDLTASLAIGALAVAPSNDSIVYAGTGEGALSGDSYFGNGILKSTDGGSTWSHVSGDYFVGVSTTRLAVDPTDASHLYAAISRGRGGARRVSPPIHSTYGLWESHDGAVTWTLIKAVPAGSLGATDIRLDPQHPSNLYASFWSDKIYKSTDGGATWNPAMNGLPADGDFAASLTRFALAISHPAGAAHATLYTGFDWADTHGDHHDARIFKSTDDGASWAVTPTGSGLDEVLGYCGTQCFYDNVVEVDPTNPDIVFAGGSFGYNMSPPSGGIFRSDDGGSTWKNLGWNMHPDYHAFAFDPNNTANVLVGNDGGVWYSTSRGGRNVAGDPLSAVTWQNLNGTVVPNTAGVTDRSNLQITQFTSVGVVPTTLVAAGAQSERMWGGNQDNGTLRKSVNSATWFDLASGDGGQVMIDQTDPNNCGFGACLVYGTYFGVSLYRISDGGAGFFTNQYIMNGINTGDRSEFYIPVALNQSDPNKLFTATYRLYRTDNARAASASDVHFKTISPDLTSGCTGPAPNGGRACVISAIGIGGGTGVYTGSEEGFVYFSPDAMTSDNPTWIRRDAHSKGTNDKHTLPNRPVAAIAVDRSNYRVAYLAFNGYNAATPHQPGHVFKTTDAGASFTDISANLPDIPVNSLAVDASYPNTLYAGTDVGPYVTYNGGASWSLLGTAGTFPIVAIDQIDLDTYDRLIAAGTHGRGAFRLKDPSAAKPALVISKTDAGVPIGPGKNLDYTIKVSNIGNADATGVVITDPIPANTTFVAADGGTLVAGKAIWTGLSIPRAGSVSVHLRVQVDPGLKSQVRSIVDDGFGATAAQGVSATGSPTVTPIAPPYAVTISPASQVDGARVGNSVNYQVTLNNRGFNDDSYTMSSSGGTFPVNFFDASCTTVLTTTPTVPSGSSTNVCVKVTVPAAAADSATSTATIKATSVASPAVSATATVKTIAVAVDNLVVDDDSFSSTPVDVQKYYTDALTANGKTFQVWDLEQDKNLPSNYLNSFKNVVWFTGNSYPAPLALYEGKLKVFLDGGGRLFLSGQDLLDQAAGTTTFVHDYLHVTWDGSETQNDKATTAVHGVAGSPVTDGIGSVPLDHTILGNTFEDRITPNGGASPAFTDDSGAADALSFSGTYKVVFLAFPMEAYGTAADKNNLVARVFAFFA
ncbi:MAG TPA: hypothetical protein VGR23_00715 [Candidatus Dormibacteraeota bacterium]|nr:hypothetical protein [Candidatus Dormibacteraeota bacterium]